MLKNLLIIIFKNMFFVMSVSGTVVFLLYMLLYPLSKRYVSLKWRYRILKLADDLLCKLRNPQQFSAENVENSVDNVDNLLPKEVFPHFNDISGPHSYQQITLDTIF